MTCRQWKALRTRAFTGTRGGAKCRCPSISTVVFTQDIESKYRSVPVSEKHGQERGVDEGELNFIILSHLFCSRGNSVDLMTHSPRKDPLMTATNSESATTS